MIAYSISDIDRILPAITVASNCKSAEVPPVPYAGYAGTEAAVRTAEAVRMALDLTTPGLDKVAHLDAVKRKGEVEACMARLAAG